jgi:resuscitation-promoting factor RpfB
MTGISLALAGAAAACGPSAGSPQQIAQQQLAARGWSSQWGCLNALWTRESGWNPRAYNPSSGAYGIPQALPGSKMASAGADWYTNPATQISWGLSYIAGRYGSPCGAWNHSLATGWY